MVLQPAEWSAREQAHTERVRPWVEPRLRRRREGRRHPVDDFLFEYYRLSPGRLLDWHPGWGVEVVDHPRLAGARGYRPGAAGWTASPDVGERQFGSIERALRIMRATAARPASFGCFGMHEWAMVYRAEQIRHSAVPLRVSAQRVADTVESVGLRCTHFDAYRFFTAMAQPLQEPLTRDLQQHTEQAGCIHAGMDLYRYAYEALPLISSETVADCLAFAREAREVDMRASPYDLSDWGLAPIEVDTPAGRRQYAQVQQELHGESVRIRARLSAELAAVHDWVTAARDASPAPD